jgi:hypothetical protein
VATKTKERDADLEAMLGDGPQDAPDMFENEAGSQPQVVDFDFSGSEDLKPGKYHARVQEMWYEINANSGNPQFVVKLHLPEANRSINKSLTKTPAAMGITGANLRALGFGPSGDGSMGQIDCNKARGRVCVVEAEHSQQYGPQIKRIYPPTEETMRYFRGLDGG